MEQPRTALHETGARTVLVRGETAPARPTDTVTVAPGAVASFDGARLRAPLYVTAERLDGRTVRRYDGRDVRAVGDCAAELAADREPSAVWLCGRDRIGALWADGVARALERRLSDAADSADAPLVVWADERDGTVDDRYDVVVEP